MLFKLKSLLAEVGIISALVTAAGSPLAASNPVQETLIQEQNATILATGVVVDKNGDPVIGAEVFEKGTRNGSISDPDGRFVLRVRPGAILLSLS